MKASLQADFEHRLSENLRVLNLTEQDIISSLELTVAQFNSLKRGERPQGVPSRKIDILNCLAGSPEELQETLLSGSKRGRVITLNQKEPREKYKPLSKTEMDFAIRGIIQWVANRLPDKSAGYSTLPCGTCSDADMLRMLQKVPLKVDSNLPFSAQELAEWKERFLFYAQDMRDGIYY